MITSPTGSGGLKTSLDTKVDKDTTATSTQLASYDSNGNLTKFDRYEADFNLVRVESVDLATETSNEFEPFSGDIGRVLYVTGTGTIKLPTDPSPVTFDGVTRNQIIHFVNDNADITFVSGATIRSDGETFVSGTPQGDGKKKSTKSGTGVTAIYDGGFWWLVGKLSS